MEPNLAPFYDSKRLLFFDTYFGAKIGSILWLQMLLFFDTYFGAKIGSILRLQNGSPFLGPILEPKLAPFWPQTRKNAKIHTLGWDRDVLCGLRLCDWFWSLF